MELKTFKRLSNGTILLEGVIWGNDPEKAIQIVNLDTGFKAHSVKIEDNYYYPYAVTKDANVKQLNVDAPKS
jgi:hypothetical protein